MTPLPIPEGAGDRDLPPELQPRMIRDIAYTDHDGQTAVCPHGTRVMYADECHECMGWAD